jgi:predicted porin
MFRSNTITAALAAAGILVAAAPARADQLSDLQLAVQKLQAQIDELKAQQAANTQKIATQPAAPAVTARSAIAEPKNPEPPVPTEPATLVGTASALPPIPRLLQIQAGGGNFMLYGDIDEYLNVMHSSKGITVKSLQDGAILRSRLGFTGSKDFGSGYGGAFTLETGLNATNGTQADQPNANTTGLTTSGRLFDRQAWGGMTTPYGDVRVGRQNTEIFFGGNFIDYTERTLGSVVNSFGVPSRYDGDFAYISPRLSGVQVAAHYAIGGGGQQTTRATSQGVAQFRADYVNGPIRFAYMGIQGKPAVGATIKNDVYYHNLYANYDYGMGTIYAVYIHSNNGGGALANTGGNEVGNIPSVLPGTNTTARTAYNIYQISADYRVSSKLRFGGLYGTIRDSVTSAGDASGWSVGAYWQAFSNLMFYGLVDSIDNNRAASFGLAGSAGLTKGFSGANLTGQRITGTQVGGLFRF